MLCFMGKSSTIRKSSSPHFVLSAGVVTQCNLASYVVSEKESPPPDNHIQPILLFAAAALLYLHSNASITVQGESPLTHDLICPIPMYAAAMLLTLHCSQTNQCCVQGSVCDVTNKDKLHYGKQNRK